MASKHLSAPNPASGSLAWLWLALLVVVLDQLTKTWASDMLELHQSVPLIPSLSLTLMHNTGAAFSFLADAGGWQRWFFTALALLISAFIAHWLNRVPPDQRWLAAGLALIMGGALGNVIDRILYGYVVDFIDIYYQTWHWPAFNLADSAISVGAVILIIDSLFGDKTEQVKL